MRHRALWVRSLLSLSVALGATSIAGLAEAAPYDAWLRRTPITVTNATVTALADYQVAITVDTATLIAAGELQADAKDLRFSTGDRQTELPFFVEKGLNTASTVIWVRVPALAANADTVVQMFHGKADALQASNASTTFDFWEPFDQPATKFASECGTGTLTVANGDATVAWSTSGVFLANAGGPNNDGVFPLDRAYRVDAEVKSSTGNWPGLYWFRATAQKGYALLRGASDVRISVSGASSTFCGGHNWASAVSPVASSAGLWSFAWPATGKQYATYPGVGEITATHTLYARDEPLRLALGGISSGTGSYVLDWVRVRKWAEAEPAAVSGAVVGQGPGAPTITTATPSKGGQVTVVFTPPGDAGGSPVTGYTVDCGGKIVKGTTSPLVVDGLPVGVETTCTVLATNAAGDGPASAPVKVTPIDVPGAPTIGAATPGDARATIAFTPPASTNGSPITKYTVTCNPGAISVDGAGSPILVAPLTNGTPYTCTVTATNAAGTSAPSDTVAVTPKAGDASSSSSSSSGSSGTSSGGSSSGTAPAPDGGAPGADDGLAAAPADDAGCGCRSAGGPEGSGTSTRAALAVAVGALLLGRRRSRRT